MARRMLRHNKSLASPGAFIFFDTETTPRPVPSEPDTHLHTLRLGVAHYLRLENDRETRQDKIRFTSTQEFWSWAMAKLHRRIPTWIWTHNVGFDLTVCDFWRMLGSGEFEITDPDAEDGGERVEGRGSKWGRGFMLLNDPPTVISGRVRGKGRFVICDTMNYFVTSLAKMGKQLGRDKMAMPDWNAPDDEWFTYCENDVLILRECVLGLVRWVKEQELGRFRYTAPAQALGAMRHRFMPWKIEYHDEADVRRLERQCYYGGRLEAFYLGSQSSTHSRRLGGHNRKSVRRSSRLRLPFYELDVCSLYPHVMRSFEYPRQLVDSSFERGRVGNWKRELAGDCAALVRLDTQTSFPVRERDIGTFYPVGRYWTCLCGPELQRACDSGVVTDCAAWSRYHLAGIFDEFVDYFWGERRRYELAGNNLYATMCKLMLNGLYGKFGQKSAEWVDRPDMDPPRQWGPWSVHDHAANVDYEYRVVGGNVQERVECGELINTSPAIAAFVTSYGREYMLDLMNVAGSEHVYYCVTDALIVDQTGFDRLSEAGHIATRELGKLDIKNTGNKLRIEGLHHVTLGNERKHGSVKANAKKIGSHLYQEIHFQHLAQILDGREVVEMLWDDENDQYVEHTHYLPPLPGVLVYPIVKEVKPRYTRGVVRPDGRVDPLTLSDERSSHDAFQQFLSTADVSRVQPGRHAGCSTRATGQTRGVRQGRGS